MSGRRRDTLVDVARFLGPVIDRSSMLLGLLAVSMVVGCKQPGFSCSDDQACSGGEGGRCEAVGHCSFPDPACPSGRRFGEHSGAYSGRCVPEEEATGDDAAEGTTANDSGAHTQGGDDPTAAETSAETMSTSTTDGSDASTGGPTGDTMGGSTGIIEPAALCEGASIFEEHFDVWPLPRTDWTSGQADGITTHVQDGVVHVAVDVNETDGAYFWAWNHTTLAAESVAGFEVLAAPLSGPAELVLGISDSTAIYAMGVYQGQLDTFVRIFPDTWEWRNAAPWDPQLHRWFRIAASAEAGTIEWQTSSDGNAWDTFDSESSLVPGFDVADAVLEFGCGVWQGPIVADPLCAFAHAFICEP